MHGLRVAGAMILSLAVTAAPASAGWSPAVRMPHGKDPSPVAVATDGHGDAAAAWVPMGGSRRGATVVWVAVRRGRRGAWSVHPLRRPAKALVAAVGASGIALGISRGGEVTVAWVEKVPGGHRTVRAAYRSPRGRWSSVQRVGYATPFAYAYPRVAVARDGTAALVYDAGVRGAPGMAVAWRRPGRRFGRIAAVPGGMLSEPTLVFDRRGRAFLAGIASCGDETRSRGVLLTARPGAHRFSRPRTVTPRPATQLRFLITGAGHGIAAWIGAGCSGSEGLPGSLSARWVEPTRLGPIIRLAPSSTFAIDPEMVTAPGGADITWINESGVNAFLLVHVSTGGVAETPHVPSDGWVPIAADAVGDQVVQSVDIGNPTRQPRTAGARRAGVAAVAVSPLPGPAWWTAAGSPTGRNLIVASAIVGALRVATWMP